MLSQLFCIILRKLFLPVMICGALLPVGAQSVNGIVRGKVLDANGSVLPNVTVVIENEKQTYKSVTDPDGLYEVELPAGIYSVTTDLPGWYPVRRARFRIEPNTNSILNLRPPLKVSNIATHVSVKKGLRELVTVIPVPNYEEVPLPDSPEANLSLLFQYARKRITGKRIIYHRASLTYNRLTVSADEIALYPRGFWLLIKGNVLIEDGTAVTHKKSVVLKFKGDQPLISERPSDIGASCERPRRIPRGQSFVTSPKASMAPFVR